MSYRVTVRRGPKVSHQDYETLNQALAAIEREARGDRRPVNALGRTYEPGQLVAARIELKGAKHPAGVDVRGDGSLVAWTGRLRRKALEGEDALQALRQSVSVDP
ncbi:hypothetical protein DVA67_021000 [Solirubrobacter sp. CPCC 204708]|uniref:Uncharacterized protein n=1 Tax=Solirubrobacter deserti TaxID=2282478 RepID=A0ABT4REG9_9ACTN|nr:hypothetical protein [Solirubrobacter deserti]MBE2318473.1 hypothetical protein [Solirubrobacter deserti]MDA0136931.1 hypothetical protein [Solirubrobacter deserti]